MLLKTKIFATSLIVYEILAVILMHCGRICDAMFGTMFCDDHVFKYFIACFVVPAIISLIVLWIMHGVHAARRRRSFFYRAKSAVRSVASNVRDSIGEHVSQADMERLMAAALLVGVKRYISRNPRRRGEFSEILGADFVGAIDDADLDDEYADVEYVADDDDDDGDDDASRTRRGARQTSRPSARNARRTSNAAARNASKKSSRKK